MTKGCQQFRNIGSSVKLGLKLLSVSYKTIQTERLRNSHSPSNNIRTAWPMMLTEFSDLIEGQPSKMRIYYSPEEVRRANEICDIFSKLPYTSEQKKLTLMRARTTKSWREIAKIYNLPWEHCRSTCDMVVLHLVQVAALDKYKQAARQKTHSMA